MVGLQNGSSQNGSANGHGPDAAPSSSEPVKVIVSGAGPAGLLLAHYLLSFGKDKFKVIIYDKAEDPRETLKQTLNYRRYTIGISRRGENVVRVVPGLVEKVRTVTVKPDSISMVLPISSKPFVSKVNNDDLTINASSLHLPAFLRTRMTAVEDDRGWLVDRFSLCASLLQALEDMHADKVGKQLVLRFKCACSGVNLQKQSATFVPQLGEGKEGVPVVESYDLLVGADGLRSQVRLAFQQQIRNFDVEQMMLPGVWTVSHFPCPEGFSKGTFHMCLAVPKGMGVFAVPSPDGSLCFILGWEHSNEPKEWLACSTPAEAKAFIDARLPHFQIPEEAAWKLRSTPVQSTMQVKCWQYHDTKGHAVLIGDAAHATPPSIGQGCNASLVDASVLGRLLLGEAVTEDLRAPDEVEHAQKRQFWEKDPSPETIRERLPHILERFSALQVKEGQALVDISGANGPTEPFTAAVWGALFFLRIIASSLLPWLFSPPVMALAGQTTLPYSVMYERFKWESDLILWSNSSRRAAVKARAAKALLEKDL